MVKNFLYDIRYTIFYGFCSLTYMVLLLNQLEFSQCVLCTRNNQNISGFFHHFFHFTNPVLYRQIE